MDKLSERTEQLVFAVALMTKESALLAEQLMAMERNARQYQVLGEASLLELYEEKQHRLLNSLGLLQAMDQNAEMSANLVRMERDSKTIAASLSDHAPKSATVTNAIESLSDLKLIAEAVVSASWKRVQADLEALQEASRKALRGLSWQAAALIGSTIVLVLFFTALIVRPVRQIGRAIHRLGEGDFDRAVAIGGPQEFESLGHDLDWLRTRLAESEQAKRKFLRHISHELKSPLASIREGTELLIDGTLGSLNPTQAEVAEILRDKSLDLQALIENLLDFSARHQLDEELNNSRFGLRSLVNDIRRDHRLTLEGKRLSLVTSGEDFIVEADREKLHRALENLLSNAIKFSPTGTEITISARRTDNQLQIEISDCGPGVSPQDKKFIFQPLYKGAPPMDSYVRGSGLGLSVSRDCIVSHGGTISLVDVPLGARFRISLPLGILADGA
ncbi:MAG: HAMP domain-containing histidine kinase [Gammaproteobacteria bacterium]|nr:HAMP domain-containing histidine kinase [Gammaproteobacteria bacterium]